MTLPSRLSVVPLALACLPVHAGCEQLEDGAVEVSWNLYYDTGRRVRSCDDVRIESIVLYWSGTVTLDDGTLHGETRSRDFACSDSHGVTRFDFPPGDASLWLAPRCEDGVALEDDTYDSPPPIVRTITAGEVVTLDTQLIQVTTSVCTAP